MGELRGQVEYEGQKEEVKLVVMKKNGPSLLGRHWLEKIQLNWKRIAINHVSRNTEKELGDLLSKCGDIFGEELGRMEHFKAKLSVKADATPKFYKPQPVPLALREAVGQELDRLESRGILQKIPYSEWAAPNVVVPKPGGKLRLCGDYKVTVNQALEPDKYPLPKPEDLFTVLTGGDKFSKLDLREAYMQMELEEESRKYVAINTHQGLYQFTRVPYGISSAPTLFQKTMDTILQGKKKVICYIDVILITGENDQEHLQTLADVLETLKEHGIKIKREKCEFLKDSVQFLGHKIDSSGIHADPGKMEAIAKAPRPKNQQQLKSFLGLLQYYGKFLSNLSSLLHPLNNLLKSNSKWSWSKDCELAFKAAKERLMAAPVLAHYDPKLPLRLAGDASNYGIGAVISHFYPDGSERPVAYASRTLSKNECNYAQLEKEALSLVFGVKKFHKFLYGREFTLYTDHKPLTSILGQKREIPPLAAARLQRWALILAAYQYNIQYKPTKEHGNADGLSRLPLQTEEVVETEATVFNIKQMEALPVTVAEIKRGTRSDPILSKVLRYTKRGWPLGKPRQHLKPYYDRRLEMSVEEDCILWGVRVVVPSKFQSRVLDELHDTHPGIVRMKAIARSYFWWPQIDKNIEVRAKSFVKCKTIQGNPRQPHCIPGCGPLHRGVAYTLILQGLFFRECI